MENKKIEKICWETKDKNTIACAIGFLLCEKKYSILISSTETSNKFTDVLEIQIKDIIERIVLKEKY